MIYTGAKKLNMTGLRHLAGAAAVGVMLVAPVSPIRPALPPLPVLPGSSWSLAAAAGSPLIEAVKRQDAAAVRQLLAKRADVNATDADGSTALHWAVQRNDAELVRQ